MGVMGLSDFLNCFCGGLKSSYDPSLPPNASRACKACPEQDGYRDVVAVNATEELLKLQRELSAFSGNSAKSRLTHVLATVSAYTNADASLFGVIDDGQCILLAYSHAGTAHGLLGTEPGNKQVSVLKSMLNSQRPTSEEYQVSDMGSASEGEGLYSVHATPLFWGQTVAGALLLEASPAGSAKTFPNTPATADPDQAHAWRARQLLFSSPTLLHQLGLTVSVGLGIDGEQLQWLARALHRVANCDSMNCLVWELCEDFSTHVKRRFIVDANVRAALMPRADAPLGLLFHAHPSNIIPRGRVHDPNGALSRSGRSSMDCATLASGSTSQPQLCASKLGFASSLVSRNRLGALTTSSATGSVQASAPERLLALHNDAMGGGQLIDPHQVAVTSISSPANRTIVVQLPAHMAAEAPLASLHAQAFPLKHTALQTLACSGGGVECNIARISQQTVPGSCCIEDVALYLQNVHNPSRDVCLLLGALRSAGQPASPRTTSASCVTSPFSPLSTGSCFTAGSAVGAGGLGSAAAASLQSLVLVGLRLGDSILSFYLCFSKRLPGELLMAIRDSCNEFLGEVFIDAVQAKVGGSLAAEFETLRSTVPGHFAVLRSASVNGLLHRPGSQVCVSARAARLIALPRTNCGMLTPAKATSGYSEFAAAPTMAAAAASIAAAVAVDGTPFATSSKLLRRPSTELCSSLRENTQGANMPRAVSFIFERATGTGTAPVVGEGGGKPICPSSSCVAHQTPRELIQQAPQANEELMSVLLQMRQSETVCSQGEPRSASIMTVTGVDAAASARQHLDFLVTSIQTTMTTEVNSAMFAFPEDLESLELLEVLGKGGGGIVYRGRLGNQEVAVKVMELPDLDVGDPPVISTLQHTRGEAARSTRSGPGGVDADMSPATQVSCAAAAAALVKEQLRARRALLRNAMEMAVQGRLSHPNLIQVYATYTNVLVERRTRADGSVFHCLVPADIGVQDFGLPSPPMVCCTIVAELADCGSLAAVLSSRTFPRLVAAEKHAFQVDFRGVYMTLLDVALALRHLHSMHLVHRDIKPANLLLKSNPRDYRGFMVKLADFGFVLQLTEVADDGTRYVMAEQACGTVTHMAPELLPGKARVEVSADIYSFGILMWELVSGGVRPFPHLPPDQIPRHVYKGARPTFGDLVPLTYRGLAQACWAPDPHRRPKAADLVTMITAQMQELD